MENSIANLFFVYKEKFVDVSLLAQRSVREHQYQTTVDICQRSLAATEIQLYFDIIFFQSNLIDLFWYVTPILSGVVSLNSSDVTNDGWEIEIII